MGGLANGRRKAGERMGGGWRDEKHEKWVMGG